MLRLPLIRGLLRDLRPINLRHCRRCRPLKFRQSDSSGHLRRFRANLTAHHRSQEGDAIALMDRDWLIGVIGLEPREHEDILRQFPTRVAVFTDKTGLGMWGHPYGCFLRLSDLQDAEDNQRAYITATRIVPELNAIIRVVEYRARGLSVTKWVARFSASDISAIDTVDLTALYAEPVVWRILPDDESTRRTADAPKPEDCSNPTWAEFIQSRLDIGDLVFRRIVSAFATKDYKDLYLVYEAILSHFDSDKKRAIATVIRLGWATQAELESYHDTANKMFRHHTNQARKHPYMDPAVADSLMRRMFAYFIVHRTKKLAGRGGP
jgi:hypothetical protein